jgi:small conductance mechanosensitive channel
MPRTPQLPTPPRMFETRSQAWAEVGLEEQVSPRALKRARVEGLVLAVLFVVVVVVFDNRLRWFGSTVPAKPGPHGHQAYNTLEEPLEASVQVATAILLLILGWRLARDAGRALAPALFRRMDPATAGTVGFLIRLATVVLALLVALSVAGVQARTLALGGAFTAVVLGLAAQQTLGNLIAGTVLLSAGPFRVGEHVRLQGGPLAGQLEGVVSSLGLLYTTFATDEGSVLVPNSVVLNVALHTGRGRIGSRRQRGSDAGQSGVPGARGNPGEPPADASDVPAEKQASVAGYRVPPPPTL